MVHAETVGRATDIHHISITHKTMEQTTDSAIKVTRNISKVDEMSLETERYTVRGEVDVSAGTVRKVDNGSVFDRASGMFLGGFNAQGLSVISVNIQNVATREERIAVYDVVETFVESAAGMILAANHEQ